jgi:dipeptidyl aminopeptidase/acylaminoacyl peptidase
MRLDELKPVNFAPKVKVPALFIHGVDDDFIPMSHTEAVFEKYGSTDKDVIYCEGDHNSERPKETIDGAVKFFQKHLA